MVMQAIGDRVFVRLDKNEVNGILLPDDVRNPGNTGIVTSIGEQVKAVKTGDRVVFHTFDELPLPEKGVVAVRERSLLGVFND